VDLSDDEVALAAGVTNGQAELITTFNATNWDVLALYRPSEFYYVRPKDKSQYKAYTLLLSAMRGEGLSLLFKFVSRGKERLATLNADGEMTVLHWSDAECEEPKEAPEPPVTEQELNLACELLRAYEKSLPWEINASVVAKVEAYAQTKAAGQKLPEATGSSSDEQFDDLMSQLMASVKQAKSS
jgi:non-homologous end joining protein Ku